jgi:hypothetical protein
MSGGVASDFGSFMYTSQPTTFARYPIGMREPRAFGVEDRPPCPSCGAEMYLFRRSPEPGHHAYEVQIFSCMKCDAEITRSADRMGKPHPSAVLIELETPSISYFGNNAKLFFKESVASRRLQPRLGTAR